ncbi:glyoxalase-like domain protein [bacterium BMS3Abin04]|nr:glyoxalase-like domain protein [bacterium BMS3Abin04]
MQAIEFILYVSDQILSKEFYSKVLELKPILDVPGMTEFTLSENVKLGLMPNDGIAKILTPKAPHPVKGQGIPRCELYLVFDTIEEYFERAIQFGGKEVSPIKQRDWGDIVGYVSDPDGHILAFAKKQS